MLCNTLILTLLSTSITARRDKSILYSRIAIFILLSSAFIAYDNLFILFLAKGIGIFGGLFQITVITNVSHIFIFLIISAFCALVSFDRFYVYRFTIFMFLYEKKNIIVFIFPFLFTLINL